MRAFIVALLLAFIIAVPVRAADDDGYVFILSSDANPFWQAISAGIHDSAAEHKIAPVVLMVGDDRAAEEQLNTCLSAVNRHPKIIVMASLNPASGMQCFKEARAKGILVADIDSNITMEDGQKAGVDLAYSVGSDNYVIGGDAADYVKSIIKHDDAKILIIEGMPGSSPGRKRVDGFVSRLKEVAPKAQIVASVSGEWDRLKAMNVAADTLQRVPDLGVIYAANDVMALGAVEAVKVADKTQQVAVIGVDGMAEARDAVIAGKMNATVAQLPYLVGKSAMEQAVDAVNGHPAKTQVVTPSLVLTADKIKDNTDPNLQYVR